MNRKDRVLEYGGMCKHFTRNVYVIKNMAVIQYLIRSDCISMPATQRFRHLYNMIEHYKFLLSGNWGTW